MSESEDGRLADLEVVQHVVEVETRREQSHVAGSALNRRVVDRIRDGHIETSDPGERRWIAGHHHVPVGVHRGARAQGRACVLRRKHKCVVADRHVIVGALRGVEPCGRTARPAVFPGVSVGKVAGELDVHRVVRALGKLRVTLVDREVVLVVAQIEGGWVDFVGLAVAVVVEAVADLGSHRIDLETSVVAVARLAREACRRRSARLLRDR